jgi:NAD(P)-dependent dehydrogenase (short-subunit alcohol dehydrogenase family)
VNDQSGSDLFGVAGKAVVVTGGSRGIGRMIATGFVEAGARVYISSRKADELRATAEEIGATAIPADLSTAEGCRSLAAAVSEREPAVHVLVNNAGAAWGAPLEEYPESAWDKVLATNVKGPFLLTQALLGPLKAAGSADDPARVIMIGSIEGFAVPFWNNYAYPASKAAVHQMTRHLAADLAPDVTVNAIAPGLFPSKMTAFAFQPGAEEEIVKYIPMRRAGRPSDMAGVALFLASEAASYITGAVLPVDGGRTLRG